MAKNALSQLEAALSHRLLALANDIFAAGIEAGKAAALANIMSAVGQVAPAPLQAAPAPLKRGPGRPRKNPLATVGAASVAPAPKAAKTTAIGPNDKACKVPSCSRKVVAKGLCQSHYRKANASKYDLDALTPFQLEALGQDGRATRWEKNKKK